jgi:hypothetical protein
MLPHPTRFAFVRASTLSLGSIAFGSLIVTILELITTFLNLASQQPGQEGKHTLIFSLYHSIPSISICSLRVPIPILHCTKTIVYQLVG